MADGKVKNLWVAGVMLGFMLWYVVCLDSDGMIGAFLYALSFFVETTYVFIDEGITLFSDNEECKPIRELES